MRARPREHVPAEPRHRDPLWTHAQAPSPRAPPTTPPYLPLRSPRPLSRVSEPVSAAGNALWVHAAPPPSPPWSGDLRRSGLPFALPELPRLGVRPVRRPDEVSGARPELGLGIRICMHRTGTGVKGPYMGTGPDLGEREPVLGNGDACEGGLILAGASLKGGRSPHFSRGA